MSEYTRLVIVEYQTTKYNCFVDNDDHIVNVNLSH